MKPPCAVRSAGAEARRYGGNLVNVCCVVLNVRLYTCGRDVHSAGPSAELCRSSVMQTDAESVLSHQHALGEAALLIDPM